MKRKTLVAILLIIAAIIFSSMYFILSRLMPKEKSLTELYFENHLSLPRDYVPGQSVPFAFTIHNLEHQRERYDYEVTTATPGGKIMLSKDTIVLNNNEYKTASQSIQLATSSGKTKIEVSLINKNQNIHFWTDNIYTPKK